VRLLLLNCGVQNFGPRGGFGHAFGLSGHKNVEIFKVGSGLELAAEIVVYLSWPLLSGSEPCWRNQTM
jgi:hypothetical protein